ncbi:MAG: cation-translocating P-type ATPase [bacterium]|nr:cation-translocating P-type ATPase [bacterium]
MKPIIATPFLWHTSSIEDVFTHVGSDPHGLSSEEAGRRLSEFGRNELRAGTRTSALELFVGQFKNVLVVILLIATTLSFFLGHSIEAIAIAVIVLFAVILGFLQEYRAEKAIEALRKMAAPMATVLRDGEEEEIFAHDVVPGDVLLLKAGDKVPADARMIEVVNLKADEGVLTGESVSVEKHTEIIRKDTAAVADRKNMVYAGTIVSYGRGRAVTTATGMRTEFGSIATMLQHVKTELTPLQKNLNRLGHVLARVALVIVAIIVAVGVARGQSFIEMFIFGIALAVAVVPEALPAVVTISLAFGVQRMVKRHALVRRLSAVETLGSTSVICSDKTGTLTKDEMTVRKVYVAGHMLDVSGSGYDPRGHFSRDGVAIDPFEPLIQLLRAGSLASDAHLQQHESDGLWHMKGDPTEGALVVVAAKAGLHKGDLDNQFPRVQEIPFSAETKRMTTLHTVKDGVIAYAKGAPEMILATCTRLRTEKGIVPLTEKDREAILKAEKNIAGGALRVLAIAEKSNAELKTAEQDMTFLGLVGMMDPPRVEAKAAVERCQQAGIKVVMITGDHPITAEAIARELGILQKGKVVTGVELDAMNDSDFASTIMTIEVYARVSPAHKLRVVTALQQRGKIVAMTGDGVNDAPALKKADIGIAMGITGTDVTREAAAMTLTDDNFASIVAAVEEGRGIFSNIKKYLMYLLSSNIGEIGLMAGTALLGLPLPLSAVQILYVNLATDGLPALALAMDPPEDDLMDRPPRDRNKGIFTRPVVTLMMVGGLWSTAVNVGIFTWVLTTYGDINHAMTMTFVSLTLIQFFKAYNFRSDRLSVLHRTFANRWLNAAILWELFLLIAIVHVPFFHAIFGTRTLSLTEWMIAGGLAASVSVALEVTKYLQRRLHIVEHEA